MNIYSRISPTDVLHIISRKREIHSGRIDLVDPLEMLQVAVMRYGKGQTFRPHKHKAKPTPSITLTAESWIVVSGLVQVTLYDTDDTLLHTDVLEAGDISITIGQAGHNYLIMSEDAYVAEFKSGPYAGENDKIFI